MKVFLNRVKKHRFTEKERSRSLNAGWCAPKPSSSDTWPKNTFPSNHVLGNSWTISSETSQREQTLNLENVSLVLSLANTQAPESRALYWKALDDFNCRQHYCLWWNNNFFKCSRMLYSRKRGNSCNSAKSSLWVQSCTCAGWHLLFRRESNFRQTCCLQASTQGTEVVPAWGITIRYPVLENLCFHMFRETVHSLAITFSKYSCFQAIPTEQFLWRLIYRCVCRIGPSASQQLSESDTDQLAWSGN